MELKLFPVTSCLNLFDSDWVIGWHCGTYLSACKLYQGFKQHKTMSECQLICSPVVDCKRCAKAKRIFEGECCALAYNEDGEWFDDEDEEFTFANSSGWFENAFVAGLKERDDMLYGFRRAFVVLLEENVRESLDYDEEENKNEEKNEEKNKTVQKKSEHKTVEKK